MGHLGVRCARRLSGIIIMIRLFCTTNKLSCNGVHCTTNKLPCNGVHLNLAHIGIITPMVTTNPGFILPINKSGHYTTHTQ